MSQWTYFKQRRNFLVVLREILKSDHSIIGEVYKCETSHLTDPVLSLRLNHKSVEFSSTLQSSVLLHFAVSWCWQNWGGYWQELIKNYKALLFVFRPNLKSCLICTLNAVGRGTGRESIYIYALLSAWRLRGMRSATYLCLTKKALFVFNLMHFNHLDHYFTSWQKS